MSITQLTTIVPVLLTILAVAIYRAIVIAKEALRASKCNITKVISKEKGVLLITAHPDDECMFFAPTILAFKQAGIQLSLLCLSTGDYDGLGTIRAKELEASCKVLGVPFKVLDELELRDGPDRWQAENVASILETFLSERNDISVLLTFDRHGVSGHSNHCDLSNGVRYFAERTETEYTLIELESLPTIVKYLGPIAIIHQFIQSIFDNNRAIAIPKASSHSYGVMAMKRHVSQMVWFRHLYILFSSYMHLNTLTIRRPIKQ
jgi:N-acetylglucosaminylphosphatidylinositol deacetylase